MATTTASNVNYRVTQGNSFLKQLQYMYVDDEGLDAPYDISEYSFRVEVRDKPGGKIVCATCTLGDGIEIYNAEQGLVNIEISGNKTRKFNYPKAAYQIKAIDSNGTEETWLQGWFDVNLGVID